MISPTLMLDGADFQLKLEMLKKCATLSKGEGAYFKLPPLRKSDPSYPYVRWRRFSTKTRNVEKVRHSE